MANNTLNDQEINALMEAIQEGTVSPSPYGLDSDVLSYDLTSQDRIIRGQMPTLDAINDRIASLFAAGLTGRTRLAVTVTSKPATLMKFADFNSLLAPPATVGLVTLGEGLGSAVMVLDPGIADAMLAAAMGDRSGRPASGGVRRDLTVIDRLVLRRILSRFTDAMETAWEAVIPFTPDLRSFESDPRLAIIAAPNDVAILCSFDIEGAMQGRVQLGIPYAAVESAKKVLSSPAMPGSGANRRFTHALSRELMRVRVELGVVLGRTRLSLQSFLELEAGDVLTLDHDEADPIPVLVQGRPKLAGQPRVSGGSLAVCLEQGLAPDPERDDDAAPAPKVAHA